MVTGVHIYVDNTIDYTVMHARKPCRHKYDMGTYIFQSDVRTGRTTSWLMYVGNTGIYGHFNVMPPPKTQGTLRSTKCTTEKCVYKPIFIFITLNPSEIRGAASPPPLSRYTSMSIYIHRSMYGTHFGTATWRSPIRTDMYFEALPPQATGS